MQDTASDAVLKAPGAHALHVLSVVLVQLEATYLPGVQVEHDWHTVLVVEVQVEAAYLLTPSQTVQGTTVALAGLGQKLPAGHGWQTVLEVAVHAVRV